MILKKKDKNNECVVLYIFRSQLCARDGCVTWCVLYHYTAYSWIYTGQHYRYLSTTGVIQRIRYVLVTMVIEFCDS